MPSAHKRRSKALIDFDMGLNPEDTLGMLVALPCALPD
jgi:hypothetical protein